MNTNFRILNISTSKLFSLGTILTWRDDHLVSKQIVMNDYVPCLNRTEYIIKGNLSIISNSQCLVNKVKLLI